MRPVIHTSALQRMLLTLHTLLCNSMETQGICLTYISIPTLINQWPPTVESLSTHKVNSQNEWCTNKSEYIPITARRRQTDCCHT
uniref:Putative secreted protein n=1 Tax=Ixodes ricinus TaxID=34613 RepID=A0A6B0U8Q2_IXORI